jgi:hypothetical protein
LGDLTRLAGEQVQGNAPWQVSPHLIIFCIAFLYLYASRSNG